MNYDQPPTTEEIRSVLQADRDEYERHMTISKAASDAYFSAEKQYGPDNEITQEKKKQWEDVDRFKAEVGERIADSMKVWPEHSDIFKMKEKNESNFDNSVTAEEIKNFEKEKGVDQDVIARSLLVHSKRYNYLLNEINKMTAKNPDYNPDDKNQRIEVNTLRNELDDVGKIIKRMVEHLTKDTIKKYKEDFESHQIFAKELLEEIGNN